MAENKESQEKASKVIPEGEYKFSDIVTFKVQHEKEFKGTKHLKDGATYKLHVLHATRLQDKGIGKIV